MLKILFVILGSLALTLGLVGIVVPGLPTTPFLLLSAALYFKSSKRLYSWLINHPIFGEFIRNYQKTKSIPKRTKVYALVIMWLMISLSTLLFISIAWVKILVIFVGLIGSFFMIRIPTRK